VFDIVANQQVDPKIEIAWTTEARRRLDEFDQGKIKTIPGKQFDKEAQKLKNVSLNDFLITSRSNFSYPI